MPWNCASISLSNSAGDGPASRRNPSTSPFKSSCASEEDPSPPKPALGPSSAVSFRFLAFCLRFSRNRSARRQAPAGSRTAVSTRRFSTKQGPQQNTATQSAAVPPATSAHRAPCRVGCFRITGCLRTGVTGMPAADGATPAPGVTGGDEGRGLRNAFTRSIRSNHQRLAVIVGDPDVLLPPPWSVEGSRICGTERDGGRVTSRRRGQQVTGLGLGGRAPIKRSGPSRSGDARSELLAAEPGRPQHS
ncbi:hypothetical protein OPV22_033018 [Ensete ventricosum]|uniref:Uncharacterized protein n=1 Tax=Ensete ventricosum TaxID=4639 RepID=A0A427B4T5_ENSVE|nr:hypothetical protein OPV22_033018 [Ensete ventricosum]RRT83483.1 hypothetical protein B296_00017533 [Ensete ventricosum]RWW87751.1 hypothetical protein BHE74_00003406 [Ensete ventricosum]RZS24668.1 hypothetical protein BHM03_00057781 [Ensete ventricosum]